MRRRFLFVMLVVVLVGCDSAEPGTEDRSEIRRVVLVLETDDGSTRSAQVRLVGGQIDEVDTLFVDTGVSYTGTIQFFSGNGSDFTSQIGQEAEHYQVFYSLEGLSNVDIDVTDHETDYGPNNLQADYPVGLAYNVQTRYQPSAGLEGELRIQLAHFDEEPKTNAGLTVPPVLDVTVPVAIPVASVPNLPETITGISFRVGGSRISHQQNGPLIDVVLTGVRLGIGRGTSPGGIGVFNEHGENVTTDILTASNFYQVFYSPQPPIDDLLQITVTDEDYNGLPLGFTFEATLLEGVALPDSGSVRVQLARYDPDAGQVKDGQTLSSNLLMDVIVLLTLPQSSPSR